MASPSRGSPPNSRPVNWQEHDLFRQLPRYDLSWRALGVSVAAHTMMLFAVIAVPLVLLDPEAPEKVFAIVHLVTPRVLPPKLLPMPRPTVSRLELPPEPVPPRKPPPPAHVPELPRVEPPKSAAAPPPAPPPPEPPPAKPAVKTEVFTSAAAPVEAARAPRTVQTGGFGAPIEAARDHARWAPTQL